MGAPKQKWTAEEEAALKAGIHKYGVGKWSTILKDPEFSHALRSRSNVDLKDKWRNLNVMATGLGSRQSRTRVSNRNTPPTIKQDEDTTVRSLVIGQDPEDPHATHPESTEVSRDAVSRKHGSRLDDLILEAISKLKEPRGSSRPAIAKYIEEHYPEPADFEQILAANLKQLTETGRLIKVKNQYRIAPKGPSVTLANGAVKDLSEAAGSQSIVLMTKAEIDAELEKMKRMSAPEVAAAAARAVAAAEAAIAAAEAAAKEAEEAEAEAEAARCFHDAAQKALNLQTIRIW